MTQKNVLAIVVTYNRSTMLRKCLDALLAQTVPCHILVVDNASTDDTQQVLSPYLSGHVRCHRMAENKGGAGGFNAGMRIGAENGYRFLWIMDDDAIPEPGALEALLKADQLLQGDYGFLCSAVLWTDWKECRMNRQGIHRRFYEHIELLQHSLLQIRQATFVSCLFPLKSVMKAGLPIADFFIWGDDIEYTRRMAVRMDLPCYLVGNSIVIHHMASNTGSDISTDNLSRISRYQYAYRNENYLYRQEGLKGIVYYLARCAVHMLRIWTRGKDHRLKRSWILISSFFRGWFFHPQIEYITKENCK